MSIDELVARYRGQLDHVEQVAFAATASPWKVYTEGPWSHAPVAAHGVQGLGGVQICGPVEPDGYGHLVPADAQHIALHDPATVLRDVAIKRALLDEIMAVLRENPEDQAAQGRLRLLAGEYG